MSTPFFQRRGPDQATSLAGKLNMTGASKPQDDPPTRNVATHSLLVRIGSSLRDPAVDYNRARPGDVAVIVQARLALAPGSKSGIVQTAVEPPAFVEHDVPALGLNESNCPPLEMVFVTTTFTAAKLPRFVTVTVKGDSRAIGHRSGWP